MALLNRRQACLQLAAAALVAPRLATAATAPEPVGAAPAGARWQPWPASRATPALQLPDLEGQPWALAQERGHPVLLNFWASWCEPCRAEMHAFEALEQQFQARRLKVVAVNFKEGREVVRRFREAQALTLALVRDSYGEAARAWGVHTFPTTFVIKSVLKNPGNPHGI